MPGMAEGRVRFRSRLENAWRAAALVALLVLVSARAPALETAEHAAIASAHPLATQAGLEILEQGGNAFEIGRAHV